MFRGWRRLSVVTRTEVEGLELEGSKHEGHGSQLRSVASRGMAGVPTERIVGVYSGPRMRGLLLLLLLRADGLRAVRRLRSSQRPGRPQGGTRQRLRAQMHALLLQMQLHSSRSSFCHLPFVSVRQLPHTSFTPWRAVQGMQPEQTAQVIFDLRFYRGSWVTSDPVSPTTTRRAPRREHRRRTVPAFSHRSPKSR